MGQLLELARKHTQGLNKPQAVVPTITVSPLAAVYLAAKANQLPLRDGQDGNRAVLDLVERLRYYRSELEAVGEDYLEHPNAQIYLAQWQAWADWWNENKLSPTSTNRYNER